MIKGKTLSLIVFIFIIMILSQKEAEAALSIEFRGDPIAFGNMDSRYKGSSKDGIPHMGLTVTCTTDQGKAWFLKIKTDRALEHETNPTSVIPNTNFKWYVESTTGNSANLTYSINQREDFTIEKTIYSGDDTETQIDITMKFELTLPPLLQSGDYSTDIVFTLTE